MSDADRVSKGLAASRPSFEDFRHENGITYWWASEYMTMLGYSDMKSFKKVLDRATSALISLSISHHEQIIFQKHEVNGVEIDDFKLTRFACYLIAMNGDPKKVEVAQAQAFFAEQTRAFQLMLEGAKDIDRLIYREEVTKGHNSLMSAAKDAGVTDARDFADFTNAGYLGLYNKTAGQLKADRRLGEKDALQDYMGRTELAANLFRVTQTEERLKQAQVKTKAGALQTHRDVSSKIRKMVIENTGRTPESLPIERRLPDVKKDLKRGKKLFDELDKAKSSKRIPKKRKS